MEADWPKGRAPQVQRVHKVHLLLQSSESESRSVVSDSLQPCIVHGTLQTRTLEWYHFPSPGDLSNPGIKPRSPTLQADSLPAEPQGKPKNTGVGSLSLPADLPDSGIELGSPALQANALRTELSGKPTEL